MHKPLGLTLPIAVALLLTPFARAQQQGPATLVGPETPQGTLAAQIRLQGFPCERPLDAVRDSQLSKPDRAVWVLKCNNATYRISRSGHMAAKVEILPSE